MPKSNTWIRLPLTAHWALICVASVVPFGCSKTTQTPPAASHTVEPIANTTNDERRLDIVFVHGLGSDGRAAWTCSTGDFYFPTVLGEQLVDVGVWTINYDANASEWLGRTMPIEDRSKFLLQQMINSDLGDRPIVFVAHSMGGLLIKQMLRDAATIGNDEWTCIAAKTRGVVFLATPNAGSNLATALGFIKKLAPELRLSITQQQLEANAPLLRDLNIWYRNNVVNLQIQTKVFFESPINGVVAVVDEASSDPGISGVTPIRVDANHITISKPCDKDDIVYKTVLRFARDDIAPLPPKWGVTFADFELQFRDARANDDTLTAFKAKHVNQLVTWEAVIRNVSPDRKSPTHAISASPDSLPSDYVIANFTPTNFDAKLSAGMSVKVTGIIKESTNALGAILDQCKFIGTSAK